jgi:hypothetical protein
MSFNLQHARPLLQACNLPKLFVEELGWEPCRKMLTLRVSDKDFTFKAFAEKRGFTAWLCESPDGGLPDHATRLKLDRKLSETSFEHLIVFVTQDRSRQSWVWVRREPGKPLAVRTHDYLRDQPGDSLLQKFQALYVSLKEEEAGEVSTVVVAARARAAFDIERVTKAFYRDFDNHREAFLGFIKGIEVVADCKWYVSVMLNRLMFIYFIQRKGFLDGDRAYLRNRLERCKRERGADKFYTFYRYFLLHLFHDGLGKKPSERPKDLEALLGRIPYLNGGLFEVHELERPERYGNTIQIPDQAFEEIFDYFDRYQWHLDERPLKQDNEINPDVLGYIFEKFINQKQMGAYYTKEDITEYISKNTVIPFIFDAARAKCKVAFEENDGISPVWNLLKDNPDRYIYAAVRHGTEKPLPSEIATGLDTSAPGLLERRKAWNKAAPAEYALPTEIWREVVARRQRYEDVLKKIASGEVHDINDFITLNLDLRQFAQDVIQNCEGPDLLMAFWQAISTITILDPTGGSGAFVFAALNILDPLYEACLDRMESFVTEWGEAGKKHHPNYYKKFTEVLARVDAHPNRRYFVLKSIILNNLYAVDIMEEAVEICKLRLFLKLAAQVEPNPAEENLGIEPLPDIDFNIRAGNTLVGYANADEVRKAFRLFANESTKSDGKMVAQGRLLLGEEADAFSEFNVRCADVEQAFSKFRQCQTDGDGSIPADHKHELQKRLSALEDELNRHLASEYGVSRNNKTTYAKWLKTHQPFHWFVQFYGIMNDGGFDVIIGNPPYVELNALDDYKIRGYVCEDSGNLYALVMERCELLGQRSVRQGYIVPVSSVSTERYETLQNLLVKRENFYSSYDDRPSRLFDELEHIRLAIHIIGNLVGQPRLCSTRYNKWMSEERPNLFDKLTFANARPALVNGTLPKLCSDVEEEIVRKLAAQQQKLCLSYTSGTDNVIYYSRKVGYFLQVLDFEPRVLDGNGNLRPPSEFKELRFSKHEHAKLALCCLNSNLFYWFVTVFSDCRHVNKREVDAFPIDLLVLSDGQLSKQLVKLGYKLMEDLKKHSENRTMRFKHDTLTVQCICPKVSKPIIDEIDILLAQHYGFTEEELDFIINYDIKYRLGRDAESEEETC